MSAQERLSAVAGHLKHPGVLSGKARILEKNPDDIVSRSSSSIQPVLTPVSEKIITLAIRTPLTKARKGGLKDASLVDLLVSILTSARDRSGLDPNLVEDVCVGNVLAGDQAYIARSSVLAAGFPASTAASVTSRFCSSGLLAIQNIANQISMGSIDIGLGVGAESMSSNPDTGTPQMGLKIDNHALAVQTMMPMGNTSENIAGQFDISRKAQDEFAARSYERAEHAQNNGWTKDEIVPTLVDIKDPKSGEITGTKLIEHDDGTRSGTTAESLGKIWAAFPQWSPSRTTGGNASQITDGAAAVLLMKRTRAVQLKQPILGKFVAATVTGLDPRIMGIGPSLAIPKILEKLNLTKDDVDIFEINEAFASMGVYCVEALGLDLEKVNPRGGAISTSALGHPLGCTGVRQVVTALSELRRRDERLALTSMCVGTGMGMAGVFVSEH
ncbi:Peroxisomal 3-ketoacyl-CoA thiolase [Lachnellula arida]|uniref:acetyl-CoA C-acyltransferase n=1 Tax=Lachnellula arida TaxID=1316785 RepID=A0A8T9B878_9HELO|nr:Peroxisomal 3-ketoacyl-CoA thiolase [Lachnellula arida]